VPDVTPPGAPFAPGVAVTLREGGDATIIVVGTPVANALAAADTLATEGLSLRVLNTPFIDPLDEAAVIKAARETGAIVTVEEATVTGGLGAAVAAITSGNHPVPVRMLGVRGFAPTGSAAFLMEHFGLTEKGISAAVREVIGHGVP
jgi:transketolase